MSDPYSRPASKANDAAAAQSDDGGSPQRADQKSSFWARASRIWRPMQGSSLRDNIAASLSDNEVAGAFSDDERAMLANILRFREVRVEDIMIPRAEIEAIDQETTLGALLTIFEETGHSRMPVYAETLDDPRGMVHIRDLVSLITRQARNKRRGARLSAADKTPRQPKADFDLMRVDLDQTVAEAGIIREVLFVPPSMLASDLMKRMQAGRTQMALVIDEYGGTDGLVSHEDIVEMVIGDIDDEHDAEEAMFVRTSDDVVIADARIELEEIAAAIGPDFDVADQSEDVDTLGGLIFAELGRIPARGDVVRALPNFEFHILEADPRRIKRVRIVRSRAEVAAVPVAAGGDAASTDAEPMATKKLDS